MGLMGLLLINKLLNQENSKQQQPSTTGNKNQSTSSINSKDESPKKDQSAYQLLIKNNILEEREQKFLDAINQNAVEDNELFDQLKAGIIRIRELQKEREELIDKISREVKDSPLERIMIESSENEKNNVSISDVLYEKLYQMSSNYRGRWWDNESFKYSITEFSKLNDKPNRLKQTLSETNKEYEQIKTKLDEVVTTLNNENFGLFKRFNSRYKALLTHEKELREKLNLKEEKILSLKQEINDAKSSVEHQKFVEFMKKITPEDVEKITRQLFELGEVHSQIVDEKQKIIFGNRDIMPIYISMSLKVWYCINVLGEPADKFIEFFKFANKNKDLLNVDRVKSIINSSKANNYNRIFSYTSNATKSFDKIIGFTKTLKSIEEVDKSMSDDILKNLLIAQEKVGENTNILGQYSILIECATSYAKQKTNDTISSLLYS